MLRFIWKFTVFIYTSAVHYDLDPWQHILTSVFHILCMETLPIAGGVPIMQFIIASLIAGYVPVAIGSAFPQGRRHIWEVLTFIPLLSPPLLTYLYSGFRMGIIPYFEILLIAMMLCHLKDENLYLTDVIRLMLVTILIAAWRTESFYYIGLLFLFLLYHKKSVTLMKSIMITGLTAVCVFSIGKINASMIGNNNYAIMATIVPMKQMVDENVLTKEDKETVSKVLKVGFMQEYAQFSAEELYFMENGIVREIYSDEDYRAYKKVYCKNVLLHPATVIRATGKVFLQAAGLDIRNGKTMQRTVLTNTAGGAHTLFDDVQTHSKSFLSINIACKRPLSDTLRVRVLNMLQFLNEKEMLLRDTFFSGIYGFLSFAAF